MQCIKSCMTHNDWYNYIDVKTGKIALHVSIAFANQFALRGNQKILGNPAKNIQ